MRVPKVVFSIFFAFVLTISLSAQQTTTPSLQALTLLQRSLNALSGGQSLADATLSGTARRIAGSDDETGTVVLKALSAGASRMDLSLPSGQRSEIWNAVGDAPVGTWSGPDGISHPISNHNLMTDSAWFFPALTISRLVTLQTNVVSYVGQETKDGLLLNHLTAFQQFSGLPTKAVSQQQHLSQMEIFLDPSTFLPVALAFNIHPDNDASLDIPAEVRFSDYRPVNGIQIPFHVQKYLNNTLILDLQFQTSVLNSGLSTSAFQVQ